MAGIAPKKLNGSDDIYNRTADVLNTNSNDNKSNDS